MTITFPDWYTGGYPNIQKLTRQVFAGLMSPNVEVVSWFPDPDEYEAHLEAGGAYLRTYRVGGKIDNGERKDCSKVQFAALTRSSDDSWELIEFVRQVLEEGFGHAMAVVPGTIYELQSAGEVVGPQLTPEMIGADRFVPITYELHTKRPKGLRNYRQALGL